MKSKINDLLRHYKKAYDFVSRNFPDEPRMAKDCLYIGITLTALNFGVFVILFAIGFTFDQMFQSEFRNDMMWGV